MQQSTPYHSPRKKSQVVKKLIRSLRRFLFEFQQFLIFVKDYSFQKTIFFSKGFEGYKNNLVKAVLIKRGKRNRMFLHISAMAVLTVGVMISPFLNESNPFSQTKTTLSYAQGGAEPSYLISENVFNTQRSEKPRDKIITYTVENGDTLSTIAKKFGISSDTIKWENNLKSDTITTGDELKILPVTGIAHKVASGDDIYSIAKKYDANPQAMADFPFNNFADLKTFSLVIGEILIVPEGVKPEEQPTYVRPQRYIAQVVPVPVTGGGMAWPAQGLISQYFAWYHPGIDIAADVGTPIVSSQNGKVTGAYASGWNGGYGIHIIISGDNGIQTLYAHMSGINVSVGDAVAAGKTLIGWIGLTGRTTGPHVHFEVRNGGNVNPMGYLQ